MGKEERLRKSADFARVREDGKTWACGLVLLKAAPNGLERNRYGFVAGKRIGNAVVRNRVKRLLREIARATPTVSGWDIVLIARAGSAKADHWRLREAVRGLLGRARILADNSRIEAAHRANV